MVGVFENGSLCHDAIAFAYVGVVDGTAGKEEDVRVIGEGDLCGGACDGFVAIGVAKDADSLANVFAGDLIPG